MKTAANITWYCTTCLAMMKATPPLFSLVELSRHDNHNLNNSCQGHRVTSSYRFSCLVCMLWYHLTERGTSGHNCRALQGLVWLSVYRILSWVPSKLSVFEHTSQIASPYGAHTGFDRASPLCPLCPGLPVQIPYGIRPGSLTGLCIFNSSFSHGFWI